MCLPNVSFVKKKMTETCLESVPLKNPLCFVRRKKVNQFEVMSNKCWIFFCRHFMHNNHLNNLHHMIYIYILYIKLSAVFILRKETSFFFFLSVQLFPSLLSLFKGNNTLLSQVSELTLFECIQMQSFGMRSSGPKIICFLT